MFANNSPYYVNFFNSIKSYSQWAHPTKSIYLIRTESTYREIMDKLKPAVLGSDKLLIINVTDQWISINLSPSVVKWMRKGLEY